MKQVPKKYANILGRGTYYLINFNFKVLDFSCGKNEAALQLVSERKAGCKPP